jgi:hypothetical protein
MTRFTEIILPFMMEGLHTIREIHLREQVTKLPLNFNIVLHVGVPVTNIPTLFTGTPSPLRRYGEHKCEPSPYISPIAKPEAV